MAKYIKFFNQYGLLKVRIYYFNPVYNPDVSNSQPILQHHPTEPQTPVSPGSSVPVLDVPNSESACIPIHNSYEIAFIVATETGANSKSLTRDRPAARTTNCNGSTKYNIADWVYPYVPALSEDLAFVINLKAVEMTD